MMMKRFLEFLLICLLRLALSCRYRVTVEGLDKIDPKILNRPGGVLFLPNHPTVFVDSTLVTTILWSRYRIRPMVIEYMYNLPIVYSIMRFIDALPMPNFETSSNSLKRKRNEKITQTVIQGLREKQNFLIFPSGRTKQTAHEALDGASAAHRIVQEVPEVNVVLVRVKGLWGSRFSRAFTGKAPPFFQTVKIGLKEALKSALFFMPRRKVIIEFQPVPSDFPYKADRLEFNRYLERWYDQPDGLQPQSTPNPGDSLILVPYTWWQKEETLKLWKPKVTEEEIDISGIPQDIQQKVLAKIAELTSLDPATIKPNQALTTDLGMDSLDVAEVLAFLQEQFDITTVSAANVTTVGQIMAIAAKQLVYEDTEEEAELDLSDWKRHIPHEKRQLAEGKTIPEVFLNNCHRMGKAAACSDARSGVITYDQLKLRSMIFAEYIRKLPGKYIGIMLPASTTATMAILACQLAGKVPLMVNWTVGPRHLQAVVELSKVKTVLTSWSFIDKLQNVDLDGIDDLLVMLEDVRRDIGLFSKLKGYFLSKCSPQKILKHFKANNLSESSEAVLLFTSGTESLPKGVPLSHHNILSNQRAALQVIDVYSDDIVFGILPPFHSFGFTVTSLIGVLAGAKVAFSPDPTNGLQLAKGVAKWGVTIICGPPTFIKGLIKAATHDELKTMRLYVSGAEKLPQDLVSMISKLGKENDLIEGYGITECAPILTFTPLGKPRKGVGQPLPGIELCIVDLDTHKPLSNGIQGLILTKGPNVFSGYLNPGLNSPFLSLEGQQWYNTGDLGFLDAEGNLTLSGRLKRFVKIGGEMVSLASIEEALMQTALARGWLVGNEEGPRLAVSAIETDGEKTKIVLFCTFPTTLDDINAALKVGGFSNLVRVSAITQLPELPVMGTGKTHYRKLDELLKGTTK